MLTQKDSDKHSVSDVLEVWHRAVDGPADDPAVYTANAFGARAEQTGGGVMVAVIRCSDGWAVVGCDSFSHYVADDIDEVWAAVAGDDSAATLETELYL